jgi:hypothetical protein
MLYIVYITIVPQSYLDSANISGIAAKAFPLIAIDAFGAVEGVFQCRE